MQPCFTYALLIEGKVGKRMKGYQIPVPQGEERRILALDLGYSWDFSEAGFSGKSRELLLEFPWMEFILISRI